MNSFSIVQEKGHFHLFCHKRQGSRCLVPKLGSAVPWTAIGVMGPQKVAFACLTSSFITLYHY